MKLSIAILTELCYTEGVQTFGFTGRFAFLNAVTNHNLFIVGKAPRISGLTSRRTSEQLTAANVGRFVFQPQKARKMSRLSNSELKLKNEMFTQGMLWCSECKQFHPVKDFVKDRSATKSQANYGHRKYCIRCNKAQYIRRRDKVSQFYKDRNAALKAKFVELAGGRCHHCGYNAFNAALDFHHVYPSQKKYNPTHIIYSGNFEKAWRELDKCCLICHNCHTTYEAGMWRAEFIKREGLGWAVGIELPLDDNRYETDKPPAYTQSSMSLFTYEQRNTQLALFDPSTTYDDAGATQ